jgi:hypothetical protein
MIGALFVLVIVLALYFLPALVAYSRSLANTSSIFIVESRGNPGINAGEETRLS